VSLTVVARFSVDRRRRARRAGPIRSGLVNLSYYSVSEVADSEFEFYLGLAGSVAQDFLVAGFLARTIIRPKRAKRMASRMVDFPLSFNPVISEMPSEKSNGWRI